MSQDFNCPDFKKQAWGSQVTSKGNLGTRAGMVVVGWERNLIKTSSKFKLQSNLFPHRNSSLYELFSRRWNIIDPKCHLFSACLKEQSQFQTVQKSSKKCFQTLNPILQNRLRLKSRSPLS
jgi:hypothetical protein